MSERKLIDAEAAIADLIATWVPVGRPCNRNDCDVAAHKIVSHLRSLPAAVPVVDEEKAARVLVAQDHLDWDVHLEDGDKAAACIEARAILSAAYAGSVSVEDVRMVANAADHEACCSLGRGPDRICDCRVGTARKRLLAAVEGK